MSYGDIINKSTRRGALIGTLVGGGLGAAAGGLPKNRIELSTGKVKKRSTANRVVGAAVSGLAGGLYGHDVGRTIGSIRGVHKARKAARDYGGYDGYKRYRTQHPSEPTKMPSWLDGARNQAEAKRRYHMEARKHHSDLGGSDENFKNLQKQWGQWKGHFKEAMLRGFSDELQKIAIMGAMLGGVAGYGAVPGGLKGKLMGAAVGAGTGAVAESALKGAKRAFWDEPRRREQDALYNYVPSGGMAY